VRRDKIQPFQIYFEWFVLISIFAVNQTDGMKSKIEQNLSEYNSYDTALYDKVYFNAQKGGFVVVHKLHGKNELLQNIVIAKHLANLGESVELLKCNYNEKTPDSIRNGEFWEFKTIENATNISTAIQSALRKGKKQSGNILIYIKQKILKNQVIKGIESSLSMDKDNRIQKIALLTENILITLTRDEIIKGKHKELITI